MAPPAKAAGATVGKAAGFDVGELLEASEALVLAFSAKLSATSKDQKKKNSKRNSIAYRK